MVVAAFSMVDKANWVRFFKKTFLVANISPKVVLGMLFLILSDADVDFSGWELWWRTYTTEEAFSTIRCVELVRKKEFAAAVLNPKHKTYVVHIPPLSSTPFIVFNVHLLRRPQISDLIATKALTKVSAKYLDFANISSSDLASKLSKHTGINNHAIKLVDSQQLSYGPIYSLGPVELEILKAYIKTNLANRFIKPFKSLAGTPILFDWKSNSSSGYASTIEVSTISRSKTSTRCHWLGSCWTG